MSAGASILRPGRRLVRNTELNILGQVIPLLAGVICIPYTLRGLGPDRFGILSLAWLLVGYFSLFDLGLGRATTKFVAEAHSRGEAGRVARVVWTSLAAQMVIGVIMGSALAIAAPALSLRILRLPPYLRGELQAVLYLLSAAIPIVVCSRNLRGVLEAAQRFDLINGIRIPLGVLSFLVPMLGALVHDSVSVIVVWLVALVAVSTLGYGVYCVRVYPVLRALSIDRELVGPLLVFGGWVSISNVLVPVLIYLDRLLIAVLVSVQALTFYTAPYEITSRLLIFPAALSATLFPAFSALAALRRKDVANLYLRSLKYIVLGLGPAACLGVVFAHTLLRVWLGGDFAVRSTLVFQILSVGMLLNALSQMPANLLDGIGRPDLRAKVFLSYVLVYASMLWMLVARYGIVGAAVGWAARGGLECLLFFAVSLRVLQIDARDVMGTGLAHAVMAYCGFVLAVAVSLALVESPAARGAVAVLWLTAFAAYAWRRVCDARERVSLSPRSPLVGRSDPAKSLGA
jgi:O-antigen/teichoic acid export membrane protein